MLFTSEAFLFLFLPFTVLIYYLFLVKAYANEECVPFNHVISVLCIWRTKEYYLDDHYDHSPLLFCDDDFMDESKR